MIFIKDLLKKIIVVFDAAIAFVAAASIASAFLDAAGNLLCRPAVEYASA